MPNLVLDSNIILLSISLVATGVGIGILSGLLGIGGGTVMVPLLRLAFGFPALGATATSLFVIIPTSISGAATHIKQKTCIPALGVVMGVGGAFTSVLGVYLSSISPTYLVMAVAGVVIAYSAFSMLKKARAIKPEDAAAASGVKSAQASQSSNTYVNNSGEKTPQSHTTNGKIDEPHQTPHEPDTELTLTKNQLAGGFGIGLIAGVISGYVGVGGGFIMVPLMCAWLGVSMRRASGTSLIAILILAIPGVIAQTALGNVNYLAGVMLAIGSIPGAVIGARLTKRIPESTLRYIFAILLFIAAIGLVANELLV